MNKYIKWIIGIAIVSTIVGGIYLVSKNSGGVAAEMIETKNVEVKKSVSASGIVKSYDQADLSFPTVGTVREILVEEGEDVISGTLIAYMDNVDTQQAARAAQKTLDAAEKDLEIYRENYSTNLDAVGGEDEYYLNVRKLEDLVQKAEANYQSTLASHSKTQIYAPFDGTIIDVYKDENEVATTGEKIAKIASLDETYFEISVDQEDFSLIEVGQDAEVVLDSYNNLDFAGKVEKFTKYIDEATKDFIIDINFVGEHKGKALIGMEGDVNIIVNQTQEKVDALVFDQIFSEDGETFVWIARKGQLEKYPIEVGLEGDIYTEVKTDLSDVTVVIPTEASNAEEGVSVQVTR